MTQLTMRDNQLLAGRVVLATVTKADAYRALIKTGQRPIVAIALMAGLITIGAK